MTKPDLSGLTKKERKEFLKNYREAEEKRAGFKNNLTKIIVAAIVIVIVGGLGYLFVTTDTSTTVIGEEIPEQGREHINPGTSHPPYNSNPPTSGPHWPTPQTCDFYTEEVADEAVIHSLEHGAVWVTYKDKEDQDLINQLRNLFERNSSKVLVSPRAANDSNIALASWGRLLKLEQFDEDQISSFIRSNRNNAPEPLAPCQGISHNQP